MTQYILAMDAGTTGIRAVLFDQNLQATRSSYAEFAQYFPNPGWVEHDAEEIWRTTRGLIKKTCQGIPGKNILACGITNQRETVVAWDNKTFLPLHRAIVWQCRRTSSLCQSLSRQGWGKTIQRKTGLTLDPYFSASKMRWLMENSPKVKNARQTGRLSFGTIDSWLIAKLTKDAVHATDMSNASRTMLFDIHKKQWDAELCKLFRVPENCLPVVLNSSAYFGMLDKKILGHEIPIHGVAGDQQAALFGQGCWRAGLAKNTYGTGCFLMLNTGSAPRRIPGLLTTLAADKEGKPCYAVEGAVFIGGAVIQWLRDSLQLIQSSAEVEKIAKSVSNSAGVFFVPAFVGLGAPYWDPDARGAILGLTRGAGRAHIIRAALEAIAYQCNDLLISMQRSGIKLREVRVDGGASRNNFLMQFQADLFGLPVVRPKYLESTVLGAAALAMVGLATNKAALHNLPGKTTRFDPQLNRRQRTAMQRNWQEAVARIRSTWQSI